jgi:hypothetical protein
MARLDMLFGERPDRGRVQVHWVVALGGGAAHVFQRVRHILSSIQIGKSPCLQRSSRRIV